MPRYNYIAVHKETGIPVKGDIRANDKIDAIKELAQKDLLVTSIKPWRFTFFAKRDEDISLSHSHILYFSKHLSTIIRSGIPIANGVEILLHQAKSQQMHQMLMRIGESINSGQSLAKSLAQFPKTFTPIYLKIIELGEESGNLGQILNYLTIQLTKENNIRKKVKAALFYPILILLLVSAVGIGLINFIIPKIKGIFTTFKVQLPLPTRILLATHDFLQKYGLVVLVLLIVMFFVIRWLLKQPSIKNIVHPFLLKIPMLGNLIRNFNLAIFSRMMFTLIKSGITITEGLKTISELLNNYVYKNKIFEAYQRVSKGSTLYECINQDEENFPPFITQMINIGEKTGTMEETFDNVAESYEEELDEQLKQLSVIIEPLLLLVAGLAVAAIALSIILPIYQLPNLIKH